MTVIIDMDMPKNCFECDKTYKWKKIGKVQCPHINMPSISSNTTNRPSYCPLKSTDEILSAIANHKLTDDELIDLDEDSILWGLKIAYDLVDKYCKENT